MRVTSYLADGRSTWGRIEGDRVSDRGRGAHGSLRAALAAGALDDPADADGGWYDLDAVELLPIVPDPAKIVCVGLNYRDHQQESGRAEIDKPTLFLRTATSQTAHRQPIVRPRETEFLDYEGEIAIVIGRGGRRIAEADAWTHIAGYAAYNDGSARDWQNHSTQWGPGKNFDRTGGFGPWLVTRDEIADGETLTLETRVNGNTVQRSSSDLMVFGFPALVSYISTFATLLPGDVIVTGTPAGVGKFRDPPLPLTAGDVVEIEVGRVGTLRNTVIDG